MYGCSIVIPDANNFDAHVSWLNNKNDGNVNKYPVIVLPFPSASSDTNHNYYMEWDIDAIDTAPALKAWNASRFLTGPTATVWRIAHTFNDPWAAQCSAAAYLSPNVSQDGRYIVFHSDWKGGTGKGTCTNSRRLDMFIADATSQGSQPPAPPPSLSITSVQ
jgi:hypothetical protein